MTCGSTVQQYSTIVIGLGSKDRLDIKGYVLWFIVILSLTSVEFEMVTLRMSYVICYQTLDTSYRAVDPSQSDWIVQNTKLSMVRQFMGQNKKIQYWRETCGLEIKSCWKKIKNGLSNSKLVYWLQLAILLNFVKYYFKRQHKHILCTQIVCIYKLRMTWDNQKFFQRFVI